MASVTFIPASIQKPAARAAEEQQAKRKVAAYARVSTDRDEQFTSYEAQIDYYTRFILGHKEWNFAGVYTDEGISGTSMKHREGFKRMIADALDDKIDLIVTKSVSRFARNTVDSLSTIRQLKEHGTECYFEKENIWTFDGKGELLITILSSLAQEESRSISQNVTWGCRKRMSDGKVQIAFSTFLGYKRGENGEMVVDEEQAKVVRDIYAWFLQGETPSTIIQRLMMMGIPNCYGGDTWHKSTIRNILTNEKYKGDALMQKTYTKDFLTKQKVENKGALPQYYVEGDHEAIIEAETFELVQHEIARRKGMKTGYRGSDPFSCRIICGECGCYYGPKVWHSNDPYRKKVYRCNNRYFEHERQSGKTGESNGGRSGKQPVRNCNTPHLSEEEVKRVFIAAVNELRAKLDVLVSKHEQAAAGVLDTSALEQERTRLTGEVKDLSGRMERAIGQNARIALDQEEYTQRYHELTECYGSAKARYSAVQANITERKSAGVMARMIINELRKLDGPVEEFDANLCRMILDHMTVHTKEDIRCVFKDGAEVRVAINGKEILCSLNMASGCGSPEAPI